MQFSQFAEKLKELEKISSRNDMTEVISGMLSDLRVENGEEVRPIMYMLTGRIVPIFIPLEFNFSTKLLIRALGKGAGVDGKELESDFGELGDLGLVAEAWHEKLDGKDLGLGIKDVYERLMEFAVVEGKGSQDEKIKLYLDLIRSVDAVSAGYISRIITGKLRLGFSGKTILDALSWSVSGDKSHREKIERAYGVYADFGLIAELVLAKDFDGLAALKVEAGIPVVSKLVQRESSVEKVFERIPKSIIQYKYDGMRTQIHFSKKGFNQVIKKKKAESSQAMFGFADSSASEKENEEVRIFSRNLEPLTDMFPDIVKVLADLEDEGISSAVFDAEAIGVDPKTGKFIPFQETMKRKRKYEVGKTAGDIPVKVYIFDLLFLNGEDLTQLPFEDRLSRLTKLFKKKFLKKQNVLVVSDSPIIDSFEEMDGMFKDALDKGLEGLIVKDPESVYAPGTRNYDWIKLKANIDSGLIDTVDCVVLGYYYGKGSRAKFGAGAFLVGVYNKEKDRFESIAKVGSGIKEDEWGKFIADMDALKVDKLPENVSVRKELVPDVICKPEIVVVVDADEITKSKLHSAGADDKEDGNNVAGYSLRFPRLKEWGRIDKNPEDVTSVEEISGIVN